MVRWGLARVVADDLEVATHTLNESYQHYKNLQLLPANAEAEGANFTSTAVEENDAQKTPSTTTTSNAVEALIPDVDAEKKGALPVLIDKAKKKKAASVSESVVNAKTALEQTATVELRQLGVRLAEDDKKKLREAVQDLIPFIRFPLMSPYQITDMIEPFENVPDWLLLESFRAHSAPERSISSKRCQKRKGFSDQMSAEFSGSTLLGEQHKKTLATWCEFLAKKNKQKWTLRYKASRDGFDSKVFHKLCDDKGPSIIVCRSTDGYVFGGVNTQPWSSNNSWITAKDNFLFSLLYVVCIVTLF